MSHSFYHDMDNYRNHQDNPLSLSGENSEFFAIYKTQKMMEWFADRLDKPITILDFGCGDGLMTHYVQQAFWQAHVVGIDPCQKSIAHAQQKHPAIEFMHAADKKLPFEDNTFDIVFCAGVFHHIDVQDHQHYAAEIQRVTKKNGTCIIFEINPLNPLSVITFRRNPIDYDAHMIASWSAKRLLKNYGATKTIYYCFFPRWFKAFRCLEPYMQWFPFGALYATILTKKNV